MKSVVFLLSLVTTLTYCTVVVDHGLLTIDGYDKCFISINGEGKKLTLNKTKYTHEGFVVGLLKWKCDNEYGYRVIDVECKDCGIYCNYNQQFEKCKNNYIIPILGFCLSIFILLNLILITMTCFRKAFHKLILKLVLYLITRNDRERAHKIIKLNKMTGSRNQILFRYIITQSDELNNMIKEYRLALRKKVTGDEPIYEEICHKGNDANKFSKDLEMKIMSSKHHKLGESAAKALVVGLALQSAVEPTYACDKTLYIHSSGKVCDTMSCTNVDTHSIPLQSGSTVCFSTIDGDRIEMRMSGTKLVTRYNIAYYACDYGLKTKTTWECKGPGSNCWNGGNCHQGYEHPKLKNDVAFPNGYGCQSDTVGCSTWCWHETSCTWYSWILYPKMDKCYQVYHKTSEIWQTGLFVKYKGTTKHIKLNTNNPRYNLNGFDIAGLKDMPIIVTNMDYEKIHLRNSIIIKGKRGYEVDASMTNFPVKNTIGEYQMSLDKQTFTTYTNELKCQVSSCTVNCTYDEPAVTRLNEDRYGVIPHGQLLKNGEDILKRMIPVMASATLVIGTVEIDSLLVTPSYCKLSVESTVACTSCDTKPYAVIKAYDIKTEGQIEYESNCSWVQDMLSCNPEPYIFELEEASDRCLVNLKSTNQTILIDFNYIFVGQLTLLKTYYAESTVEALTEAMSNKAFWGTVLGSLNLMAMLSVGMVTIVKVVRLGIAFKTKSDVEKA